MMDKKKAILASIVFLLAIIILAMIIWFNLPKDKPIISIQQPVATALEAKVNITASGFDPATVSIKQGSQVTFVNVDSEAHRIASDPHPVHSNLAELDSGEEELINQGESYGFTFDQTGTFTYHDHLNPQLKGTVVVN